MIYNAGVIGPAHGTRHRQVWTCWTESSRAWRMNWGRNLSYREPWPASCVQDLSRRRIPPLLCWPTWPCWGRREPSPLREYNSSWSEELLCTPQGWGLRRCCSVPGKKYFIPPLVCILRGTFYLLKDGDSHIEVMVLHGRGGVDCCQCRLGVDHELVVKTSVVQVVTDCSHPQAQTLVWTEDIWGRLTTIYQSPLREGNAKIPYKIPKI